MFKIILFVPFIFLFYSCLYSDARTAPINGKAKNNQEDSLLLTGTGNTLQTRFYTPDNFERIPLDSSSFGYYLRTIKLKQHGVPVVLYNGELKRDQTIHVAVIDQDIDPVDLQQCADAVMRLRGEYLYQQKRFKDIHFNFVSDNKPRYFVDYSNGDLSYKKFRSYMKYIFSYANTASLKKELQPIPIDSILPGDVFIQSGNPYGHAVTVMDVATDKNGKRIFLLSQSYMPAQETHILINPSEPSLSPWYRATIGTIITPEWRFESTDLRRFND